MSAQFNMPITLLVLSCHSSFNQIYQRAYLLLRLRRLTTLALMETQITLSRESVIYSINSQRFFSHTCTKAIAPQGPQIHHHGHSSFSILREKPIKKGGVVMKSQDNRLTYVFHATTLFLLFGISFSHCVYFHWFSKRNPSFSIR